MRKKETLGSANPPPPVTSAVAAFAKEWGVSPNAPLLLTALRHRSLATDELPSNERLEFVGDAILGAFVAQTLYVALPQMGEGSLSRARSRVVRRETLANAARGINLPDLLQMGEGERTAGQHQQDAVLAGAYEAIIGAIALSAGDEAAQKFMMETLTEALGEVLLNPPDADAKTLLQQHLQARGMGLPRYTVTSETGVGHKPHFTIAAYAADGTYLGEGSGANKRVAENQAAQAALAQLG